VLDLFITLLTMGVSGWKKLLFERKFMFEDFRQKLSDFAFKFGERVLVTPDVQTSLCMWFSIFRMTDGSIFSTDNKWN
jgi:O-phospho-L-seryl-tRNASec:L-selenocysteinyl-tRNA synthase